MTRPNLRAIAEKEIDNCFPDLTEPKRGELVTSLVRQWVTNNGKAVIVTRDHNFWFDMVNTGDRIEIGRIVQQGHFIEQLRHSRVPENEIPSLLHDLNVRQSALTKADYGEPLLLRVNPVDRTFHIEYAQVGPGWQGDDE